MMMGNSESYLAVSPIKVGAFPRLPLEGSIDLTYRCNNVCRHCWLWLPQDAPEKRDELTFDEIRRIVDDARAMGCRRWSISGGEPMLRPDFPEIFDYLTRKSLPYSLNTNGTLITPDIARLMTRKGNKMVALYGATAEVHDHITRNLGSFEAALRGFAYLKEAGAGFTVQLVPMRDNYHQFDAMVKLATSLSPHYRVGASWLWLSACGSPQRNAEIVRQRLDPCEVVALDQSDLFSEDGPPGGQEPNCRAIPADDRLFAGCTTDSTDFHVDPYGGMSFCCFVRDSALRYDLRQGTFREAWDEFIPSLGDKVPGGEEWRANCGSCEKAGDCRACAAYAYLETGRYSARIPYLCAIADEERKFNAEWPGRHRRYFQIAGITVGVECDLDLSKIEFTPELASFAVDGPGDDNVTLRHVFELPDLTGKDLGKELYRKSPWAISRRDGTWFYRDISPGSDDAELRLIAAFNADHTRATIHHLPRDAEHVRSDGWPSLSLFATDQIWLTPLLADRNAVLLHSAAVILNGQGLLFVGHSDAGKSTTVTLLKNARDLSGLQCEVLCDDRNIVRKWIPLPSSIGEDKGGDWRVHGTWSHGDVADVSSASAPLRAILFLQQDTCNAIIPLADRKEIWKRLLGTLIRSMVTAEWWQKELDVLEQMVDEVPCYIMRFDKSGAIVDHLVGL
jgi:uncharacterized Fe-S cluster-containing radical SAM superfamily protein